MKKMLDELGINVEVEKVTYLARIMECSIIMISALIIM